MAGWYTDNLDEYYLNDASKEAIMSQNALNLMPGLRARIENATGVDAIRGTYANREI